MITPKPFQQPYIDNILALFRAAKAYYDEAIGADGRQRVFSHNGAVLLKAPTGAGKTIMAGAVAERFAAEERVVWFWFAPFKGLVGQAGMSLRDHHPGLRVRELATDRRADGTRSGDTFILTWASVVARSADARRVRQDGERFPSFDDFLAELRQDGFRIGVVIDEAHHGISSKSQSMDLFADVLAPDYSLMITATPDDSDAEKFTRAAGIAELHRVTVARREAVEGTGPGVAGLIKPAVRSVAYISPPDQTALADFEAAALQDGCTTHARIKQELQDQGVNLAPLMLLQVGSGAGAVEEAKAALMAFLFLADSDSQAGITAAAEKINQLKRQLTQTSPFTMLTRIAGRAQVQLVTNGQPDLLPDTRDDHTAAILPTPPVAPGIAVGPAVSTSVEMLELLDQIAVHTSGGAKDGEAAPEPVVPAAGHRYEFRKGSPVRFLTQEMPLEVDDILECIGQQVRFDDRTLLHGLAQDVEIIRVEKGHFGADAGVQEETRSQIKAVIEHREYGKALMIHWKDWNDPKNRLPMTVRYDPNLDKNQLDAVFRCDAMPTY